MDYRNPAEALRAEIEILGAEVQKLKALAEYQRAERMLAESSWDIAKARWKLAVKLTYDHGGNFQDDKEVDRMYTRLLDEEKKTQAKIRKRE